MDEVHAVDELGPVDWIVVEFPGSKFNGQHEWTRSPSLK
jgi:hypothetical protein